MIPIALGELEAAGESAVLGEGVLGRGVLRVGAIGSESKTRGGKGARFLGFNCTKEPVFKGMTIGLMEAIGLGEEVVGGEDTGAIARLPPDTQKRKPNNPAIPNSAPIPNSSSLEE
jgi:hypothetical protein